MKKSYDGGYGKPPKHTQFPKGISGNPKGRPKASMTKDPNKLYEMVLDELVELKLNGKKQKMTMREALIRLEMADALKGNRGARAQVFKKMEGIVDIVEFVSNPEDQEILIRLATQINQDEKKDPNESE